MSRNRQQNPIVSSSQSLMYIGPLPPSKEFGNYEQTLPGAANRILAMAEQEAEHRRKNEEKIVQHSMKKKRSRTNIRLYTCHPIPWSCPF